MRRDRLVDVVVRMDREDRAEHLLLGDADPGRRVDDDVHRDAAGLAVDRAARVELDDAAARGARLVDQPEDAVEVRVADDARCSRSVAE